MPKIASAKPKKKGAPLLGKKGPAPSKKVTGKKSPSASNALTNPQAAGKAVELLTVGKKAPSFSLQNQDGKTIKLSDLKGKKVVLYFYPKDDTPGCTQESCAFRDGLKEIKALGAMVVGVSPDSVPSHKKFANKYDLPFPLLSDESKATLEKYGVWKEKSMYGRTYMGVERTTVIIDANGKIERIFSKVKVGNHLGEVLDELGERP